VRLNHDLLPLALRHAAGQQHQQTSGTTSTAQAEPAGRPVLHDAGGCTTCTHRTPANTCGVPDLAGLCPPDRFRLEFCALVPDGGRRCPAWAERAPRHHLT
jgi:hypothetical protein